ncbi:preprotein translocase subunit SecG [Patescibacteria group bacterium]|nr:MAG: preprotein translocase subunit SecG [Patescibacteria group bacterium]
MQLALSVALIILSILLIGAVLLQGRGSGLGAVFGGDSNVYRTKRGLERLLYRATIVLAAIFFGAAFFGAFL